MTLLSGSLVFYALGEARYLPLLMLSILVNYFFGLHIGRRGARPESAERQTEREQQNRLKLNRKRRVWFLGAIFLNVGVLAAFKYGKGGDCLPLGISFYTFQVLSYLIDVYRGRYRREMSFVNFAVYISMFPKLLSGPIAEYEEVRDELGARKFTAGGIQEGLKVFTLGLVVKVLLADRIGLLWQEVQVTGFESISTPLAWLAAIAYSLKIYFDFYGYSLMSMGLGRMLGFSLPENFRNPYMAGSVREFYRRWHMTLSRWFREYVYIPLGGNRKGLLIQFRNLLIVWALTGIWHGKGMNFLVWGLYFGVLLILEKWFLLRWLQRIPAVWGHLYAMVAVIAGMTVFAIDRLGDGLVWIGMLFGSTGRWYDGRALWLLSGYGLLLLLGVIGSVGVGKKFCRYPLVWMMVFFLSMAYLVDASYNPFLYFRF